jgi:hypothetical protein
VLDNAYNLMTGSINAGKLARFVRSRVRYEKVL